jgi:hypothetical protein
MKYRFHWGWGIAVFYTMFAIALIFFVLYSRTLDRSLVVDNYYDYDIGFEKLIGEKRRNSNSLEVPLIIEYSESEKHVQVVFPPDMPAISGDILFYRVNNKNLDMTIPVNTDNSNVHMIDVSKMAGGLWKISVDWQSEGKNYLDYKDFYFQ